QWTMNGSTAVIFMGFLPLRNLSLVGPGADEVVGDRAVGGDAKTFLMIAGDHRAHLLAPEPAAILQFLAVEGNVVIERLAETADHQRVRKRPWLAGVVDHAADAYAGFLQRLATNGVLDRLARFDEAGKAGIHAG